MASETTLASSYQHHWARGAPNQTIGYTRTLVLRNEKHYTAVDWIESQQQLEREYQQRLLLEEEMEEKEIMQWLLLDEGGT